MDEFFAKGSRHVRVVAAYSIPKVKSFIRSPLTGRIFLRASFCRAKRVPLDLSSPRRAFWPAGIAAAYEHVEIEPEAVRDRTGGLKGFLRRV